LEGLKTMSWLQTYRERRERGEKGFTLIELLLVIVILGILAAVVVISVRGITNRGESAACGASYTAAITALEAYYAEGDGPGYPASLTALVPGFLTVGNGVTVGSTTIASTAGSGWTLTYVPGAGGTSYDLPDTCPLSSEGGGTTTTTSPGGGGGTTTTSTSTTSTTSTTIPAVCAATELAPLSHTLSAGSDNLPGGFSWTVTLNSACDGTALELFINRSGAADVSENFSGTTGTSRTTTPLEFDEIDNWNATSYTVIVRDDGGGTTRGTFNFTVNAAPVCTINSFTPPSINATGGTIPNTTFTVEVTSACDGVGLEIFISKPGEDVELNIGPSNNTTRTGTLTDSGQRSNWSNGQYDVAVREQDGSPTYRTFVDGLTIT
jgi:prepilin-type N-terminal cleavage/methylation domain-containing protein